MNDLNQAPGIGQDPVRTLPQDFDDFFTKWQKRFLKYADPRMRCREDAEEAVLKAAFLVYRKWDRMEQNSNPEALAFHILEKVIIDYWRDQSRQAKVRQAAELAQLRTPVAYASAGIEQLGCLAIHDGLDQALEDLQARSRTQAMCVRLRHMVGLTHDQIAALLDITASKAKSETWLGLRFLKDRLDSPAPAGDEGNVTQ